MNCKQWTEKWENNFKIEFLSVLFDVNKLSIKLDIQHSKARSISLRTNERKTNTQSIRACSSWYVCVNVSPFIGNVTVIAVWFSLGIFAYKFYVNHRQVYAFVCKFVKTINLDELQIIRSVYRNLSLYNEVCYESPISRAQKSG